MNASYLIGHRSRVVGVAVSIALATASLGSSAIASEKRVRGRPTYADRAVATLANLPGRNWLRRIGAYAHLRAAAKKGGTRFEPLAKLEKQHSVGLWGLLSSSLASVGLWGMIAAPRGEVPGWAGASALFGAASAFAALIHGIHIWSDAAVSPTVDAALSQISARPGGAALARQLRGQWMAAKEGPGLVRRLLASKADMGTVLGQCQQHGLNNAVVEAAVHSGGPWARHYTPRVRLIATLDNGSTIKTDKMRIKEGVWFGSPDVAGPNEQLHPAHHAAAKAAAELVRHLSQTHPHATIAQTSSSNAVREAMATLLEPGTR